MATLNKSQVTLLRAAITKFDDARAALSELADTEMPAGKNGLPSMYDTWLGRIEDLTDEARRNLKNILEMQR